MMGMRAERQPCNIPGSAFSRLILGDIAGDGNMCSETVDRHGWEIGMYPSLGDSDCMLAS